jgi:iron complex outermembrane recepter protein
MRGYPRPQSRSNSRISELLTTAARASAVVLALGAAGHAVAQTNSGGADQSAAASQTQTSDSVDKSGKKNPAAIGEVVVTATGTNIHGVKAVGSEDVVITRTQILETGDTNIASVLQTLPQVQTNPDAGTGLVLRQGGTTGYGGNPTQGTGVNLRGIGTAATLTLVDGHRLSPSGASNAFTEAIQVPIAALQGVEVIADGNSAIYGSDAISGVVNYILRKDYNGIEISGRDTFTRYYDEWGASITAGHKWDQLGQLGQGNFIATFDYDYRGHMLEGQSAYLRQDLTPLGGVDSRAINGTVTPGNPGDIIVTTAGPTGNTYAYYGLPKGVNNHLTFSDLSTTPNVADAADYTDYLGQQRRYQVAAFLNQDLNSWLTISDEAFYTHRVTESRAYAGTATNGPITICQSSPYFISGIPGLTPQAACGFQIGESFKYDPFKDFGYFVTTNPDTTYTNTFGLKARLPDDWTADGYFTYGHDSVCAICNFTNNVNVNALQAQVNAGNINPYSTTPLTAAQIATFTGANTQWAYNLMDDAVLKFDGPLFSLPAGKIRAAVGGEYAHNGQGLTNASNTNNANPADNSMAVNNVTTASRDIESAFGELYVPVIGQDMKVPLVKAFDIDAAVRYDHYSDFGGTTNPKVGGTWLVDDDLTLRGSWGTSFRAPSLTDTNPQNFSVGLYGIPFTNNSGNPAIANFFPGTASAYEVIGANPGLKPETATNWSIGFDYRPHWATGLRASVTYFNIAYTNQIVSPNTAEYLASPANAAIYSKYIIPVSNPVSCNPSNPSTWDPTLAAFVAANPGLYKANIFGICSVGVIIDGREANAATTKQNGLDFQLNYAIPTNYGVWHLDGEFTKILEDSQMLVAGVPEQSVLNTINYPVSLRGRADIGWSNGPWSVMLFGNYVGSYLNNTPLAGHPDQNVPSWITFDATISFTTPRDASAWWLKGVRGSISLVNMFNRNPPVVLTSTYSAFDASNANVFGREVTLQLTKSFF